MVSQRTISVAKSIDPYNDTINPYYITTTDNMIVKNKQPHSSSNSDKQNNKRQRNNDNNNSTSSSSSSTTTSTNNDELQQQLIDIQNQLDVHDVELHHRIHELEYEKYQSKKSLYEQRDVLLSQLKPIDDEEAGSSNIFSTCIELLAAQLIEEVDADLLESLISFSVVELQPTANKLDNNDTVYTSSFNIVFKFNQDDDIVKDTLTSNVITKTIKYTKVVPSVPNKTITTDDKTNGTKISYTITPKNVFKSNEFVRENSNSFFVNFFSEYDSENNNEQQEVHIPYTYQLELSELIKNDVYTDLQRYVEQAASGDMDESDIYDIDDAPDSDSDDDFDDDAPELVE